MGKFDKIGKTPTVGRRFADCGSAFCRIRPKFGQTPFFRLLTIRQLTEFCSAIRRIRIKIGDWPICSNSALCRLSRNADFCPNSVKHRILKISHSPNLFIRPILVIFLSWNQPFLSTNPLWATSLSGLQPSLGNIPLLASTLPGHQPHLTNNPLPSLGLNPLWATILSRPQPSLGNILLLASTLSGLQPSLGNNPL